MNSRHKAAKNSQQSRRERITGGIRALAHELMSFAGFSSAEPNRNLPLIVALIICLLVLAVIGLFVVAIIAILTAIN